MTLLDPKKRLQQRQTWPYIGQLASAVWNFFVYALLTEQYKRPDLAQVRALIALYYFSSWHHLRT